MHWQTLLKDAMEQKLTAQVIGNYSEDILEESDDAPLKKIEHKKFFLGSPYENIYFTGREAQVMVYLIQGKTIGAAAAILNLSPRTIEFYVKNMKSKLACRTKSELIGKIFESDFIRNFDLMADLFGGKE